MRLTELSPKWVSLNGWSDENPFYIGVTFQCPHCIGKPEHGPDRARRLYAMFDKPIDPANLTAKWGFDVASWFPDQLRWHREGDTFDTLSLTPSINTSTSGHWHGTISNGELR